MLREDFRVKPYSDRRYKFVVRAKVDGKWRRRYFRSETEAQAYADKQNRRVHAKAEKSRGQASKNGRSSQAKKVNSTLARSPKLAEGNALRFKPAESSTAGLTDSKAPKIARYLGGPWRMHLPFVYDLVRELNPEVFVELGVYKGESYFAVCQSVFENHLVTKCFGIDTWLGDLHSGLYCPEVGEEVVSYNTRYSSFSRLLAKSFKEALREFADGSIDLLHIDGAHRYEDVKEDFEMWRPKLSETGVVLFHDVLERDHGFGVYKLWQQIARPRASFLFEFGHGLGLWREKPVSKKDVPFLRRLFLADIPEQQKINRYYKMLAEEVESINKLQSTVSEDQSLPVFLQVFGSRNGTARPEYTSTIEILPSQWCRPRIDLPWGLGDGSGPLRIDPIDRLGIVDIAAVTLCSSATGEVLWSANRRSGLEELTVAGTALRLPHPRVLRLLAYRSDPQVCLPLLKDEVFQDPLSLEILLRFEPAPEAIDRAIEAWNQSAIVSSPALEPPEAEAAMPFTAVDPVAAMPASEIAEAGKITMVVYSAGESGYSEDRASKVTYTGECWSHLDIALQLGLGTKPLRLDPLTAIGLIDVAAMTIRSAINDEVLWRANGGGGLDSLQVSGSAVRIPHSHLVRVLSYGEDPQIYLPPFPRGKFDGPLRLEVWLKTETGFDSIRKGITEFVDVNTLALATTTQAQGLLEQSNRAFSEKETEVEALRVELDNTTRERDQALATTTQAQGLLEQSNRALSEKETEVEALRVELDNITRERDQALATTTQAQGLLEQSNRAFSEKETEVEALRVELDNTTRERDQALAATTQAQGLLEQSNRVLSEKEATIERLRMELQKTTRQREEALARLSEIVQENAVLEKATGSLRAELDNARQQLATTEGELSNRSSELDRTRQELDASGTQLGLTAVKLNKSREELRSQITETKRQSRRLERLRHDLKAEVSHSDQLEQEQVLLKRQVAVEHATKVILMEEFCRAGENLRSLKQDLALLREMPLRPRGGLIKQIFGSSIAPPNQHQGRTGDRGQQSPPQYRFWLDSPSGPSPAGQMTFFAGWVLPPAEEKILGVRALVRGETFVGQYGFERSDVAAAFRDRSDAERVGFSVGVPLSYGLHEVALQALTTIGKWVTFCSHEQEVFVDLQQERTTFLSGSQIDGEQAFQGRLERPSEETIVDCGLLLITGWLHFKTDKVLAELFAYVDEDTEIPLAHSLPRDDVATYLSEDPSAKYSGFEGYFPIALDFFGPLKVTIEAVLSDGSRMVCFRRDILVRLPDSRRSVSPVTEPSHEEDYVRWIERNKLTPYLLKKMAEDGARLALTGPQISIIVPTFDTPALYLEALIDSVKKQLYPRWQLCLADDASTQPHVRAILERAAATDARIKVAFRETNGHIVQASNSALALANGDYIGLLDHDDLLSVDALLHIAEAIVADRALNLLYTDEDKLSPEGRRFDPIFKGSFSPEMSLTHNYIQHFTVIRRSLVEEVGGFREGFEGAQDLDLYLRVLERTAPEQVKHLPFVCYHWRSHPESTASSGAQKSYVFESARKSITETLARRCLRAAPYLPQWAGKANCCLYQLKWSPDLLKENQVTIVIPTKNRSDLLEKCIDSLERTVDQNSVEVIVVDDHSEDQSTRDYLETLPSKSGLHCRVVEPQTQPAEFNFSQLINEGVAAAQTSLVLLLNNDTETLHPGWLEEMVGWMSIKDVGAVGAKLLYPDHTIQHAGVLVGSHCGLAEHIFNGLPEDVIGFNFLAHAARDVSAVTGACMLISKATFDEVGGFDEEKLGMEYNDVDYCLRLNKAKKRVVFTPQAVLLHHCSQSRGSQWRPAEHVSFLRRYPDLKDPFYNENLDPDRPMAVNPAYFGHKDRVTQLKVLMISHNLNLEGAPKVLFDHALYFVSAGGYDVTVVSRQDGPLRAKMEQAGIVVQIVEGALPQPAETTVAYRDRLREIGAKFNATFFDLVVCNTLTSFWGVVLAELFDLPVIWHVHESATLDEFFHFDPMPKGLVENCLAAADRVVFEAAATRRLLSRYQKRDNFERIPGSIDVGAIDEFCEQHSQHSMKIKHGIDPEKLVVNLIGTTCPRKGQHVFIEAIRLLQAEHPNEIGRVCFIMLGAREAPYLGWLRSKMGMIEGTDTRLIEERDDIFDFYRLTDILVCPSFQESFPRVILEAMAFKLPIVSTDVFGIPEIVEEQAEALLVAAGDSAGLAEAIRRLLETAKGREELGLRSHAKVTRLFNSSKQLGRQLDLTKEVVARHVGPHSPSVATTLPHAKLPGMVRAAAPLD